MVDPPSGKDIQCFNMELIADALLVRSCGRDEKVQRLLTRIAGSFG